MFVGVFPLYLFTVRLTISCKLVNVKLLEIRIAYQAASRPKGLGLEIFNHGYRKSSVAL